MQGRADQQFDLEVALVPWSFGWMWLSIKACNSSSQTMQGYAANYSAHGKINRLAFIASKSDDASIQLDALRLAADELQNVRICQAEANA